MYVLQYSTSWISRSWFSIFSKQCGSWLQWAWEFGSFLRVFAPSRWQVVTQILQTYFGLQRVDHAFKELIMMIVPWYGLIAGKFNIITLAGYWLNYGTQNFEIIEWPWHHNDDTKEMNILWSLFMLSSGVVDIASCLFNIERFNDWVSYFNC
jgi:hypothetical protein